jgi:hypothetical protein
MVGMDVHLIVLNSESMTIEQFVTLAHIQTALSAIVAILCLVKFKSRDRVIRLIGFVFFTSFLANITALAFHMVPPLIPFINTGYPAFSMVSFILLARVYHISLRTIHGGWFVLSAVIFIAFALSNLFFIQKLTLNSYTNIFYSAIIIIYCLLYFYTLMRDLPSLYLHHLPMFWFNSALLIFHAGVFFLFAFTTYLVNVLKNDLVTYWSFHNILSIIEHFIVLIGVYYDLKFLRVKQLPKA